MRRYGSVIGLKVEKKELYNKLHAEPWPEIVSRLQECNVHNYSIYQVELEKGKWYLFSYFEYTGADFDADMKKMADHPKTREWWKLTDPCQIRIPGTPEGQQWLTMKEVYHSE
ncbi:MAG: L-rhamnose mutarotase [Phycisphaerae bacterium]|nr:L-rhamnose mutarotase [Planctomycetota bacterium]MBL7220929.1 L-rhamnose mutarotase [Phycisphaerae bacterium]